MRKLAEDHVQLCQASLNRRQILNLGHIQHKILAERMTGSVVAPVDLKVRSERRKVAPVKADDGWGYTTNQAIVD